MNNIRKAIVAAFMACAYVATANAQIEGSALNYMLQRPRVAKKWKQKTYFDHLFVDAGLGTNIMGTRHPEFGLTADFNIGDWFTPEHGARININGGKWSTRGLKAKYLDLSLDYLLNITAIAQPGTYYETKRFEVYGIAGFDLATSNHNNVTKYGMGIHIGLRGQYALSDNFYTYLESRYGLMEDQISQQKTWHGYRPFTTLTMGLGYRLPFVRKNYEDPELGKHSIWDGIFVGGMVGPATLPTLTKPLGATSSAFVRQQVPASGSDRITVRASRSALQLSAPTTSGAQRHSAHSSSTFSTLTTSSAVSIQSVTYGSMRWQVSASTVLPTASTASRAAGASAEVCRATYAFRADSRSLSNRVSTLTPRTSCSRTASSRSGA